MRRSQKRGLSIFAAGLIALIVSVLIVYFGFTKAVPFRQHYEIKGVFQTSNNLRLNSPVRVAGVNVGKVVKVEQLRRGEELVVVTMRIADKGRPIKTDATFAIRPRIFLEGNFFVDITPGSPQAAELGDGDLVQANRTRTPVQIDQVLTALQADTRRSLQKLLIELSTGLAGQGGIGFNKSIQYWEPAYRDSAIVNEATLGLRQGDLAGYIRGQATVAEALDRSPPALKSLITDFNTTAAAFAREQLALEQTVAELPRTLRAARPALGALNDAFPPVRRLAVAFLPAVRSSGPTIDASFPFIREARGLVSQAELRGLVSDLRPTVPSLAQLNRNSVSLYQQVRAASSCQNEVILPWSRDRLVDTVFPAKGRVYEESVKFLPGIAGESRAGDANGQWFRVLGSNGVNTYNLSGPAGTVVNPLVNPLPPDARVGQSLFELQGINPPRIARPPLRPNVPCETQLPPDLRTNPGAPPQQVMTNSSSPAARQLDRDAAAYLVAELMLQGDRQRLGGRNATPEQRRQLAERERRMSLLDQRVQLQVAQLLTGRKSQPPQARGEREAPQTSTEGTQQIVEGRR